MSGMHKEYLAHIDMIYSPPGRKVACKKLLTPPISMASLLWKFYRNYQKYQNLKNIKNIDDLWYENTDNNKNGKGDFLNTSAICHLISTIASCEPPR